MVLTIMMNQSRFNLLYKCYQAIKYQKPLEAFLMPCFLQACTLIFQWTHGTHAHTYLEIPLEGRLTADHPTYRAFYYGTYAFYFKNVWISSVFCLGYYLLISNIIPHLPRNITSIWHILTLTFRVLLLVYLFICLQKNENNLITSWWFQPNWKIWGKLDHLPR